MTVGMDTVPPLILLPEAFIGHDDSFSILHNCFFIFIGKRAEERIRPLTGIIIKCIKDKREIKIPACEKRCRGIQNIPGTTNNGRYNFRHAGFVCTGES